MSPLPLERYREILGNKAPKSEAELRKLRDEVYRLARAVVETVVEERGVVTRSPSKMPDPDAR